MEKRFLSTYAYIARFYSKTQWKYFKNFAFFELGADLRRSRFVFFLYNKDEANNSICLRDRDPIKNNFELFDKTLSKRNQIFTKKGENKTIRR